MGAKVFGSVWIGFALGNFFQYIIVILLKDITEYEGIFWIYVGISILNFFLIILIPLTHDWNKEI